MKPKKGRAVTENGGGEYRKWGCGYRKPLVMSGMDSTDKEHFLQSSAISLAKLDQPFEFPDATISSSFPPNDRGRQAWLQCLEAFCLFMYFWGIVNTFGTSTDSTQ